MTADVWALEAVLGYPTLVTLPAMYLLPPAVDFCVGCNQPTKYIDLCFEAPLCKNCYDAKWNEYFALSEEMQDGSSPDTSEPYPFK